MNNKSDKMDRQGARTVADLELKYNMGKSFAEVMGIADTTRLTTEDLKKIVTRLEENQASITASVTAVQKGVDEAKAQLVLAIQHDSEGNPYAVISEKADYIEFNAGQIVIDTDNFKLTPNGSIIATNGKFSGTINGAVINTVDDNDLLVNTKIIQLKDSSIKFYEDNKYMGSISCSSESGGVWIDYNFGIWGDFYPHGNTWFAERYGLYMNGKPAFTGYVKLSKADEANFRCLKFINGICMGVENVLEGSQKLE